MKFKPTITFIHRWLGLTSGLVVFIVSITGCIFCFQDEVQDALFSYRKVPVEHRAYIAPSLLRNTALRPYPGAASSYIYYYGADRPAAVLASIPHKDFTFIYLNPYTGKVLHTEAADQNFFTIVETIHLYLLLPPKVGQMVVGISVIVFVVMMITGIILWWPKRKTDRKRSFTIKWGARWKRINYDLHNVLGFYVTAIALILAISGLSIAFNWVTKGIYSTANLGKNYSSEKVFPKSDSLKSAVLATKPAIDIAFTTARKSSPKAEMFLIVGNAGNTETITITAYAQSLHYGNSNFYYFDRYTGKLLKSLPNNKKSPGMRLNDLNYDIHVGQALGLPGKIIAFFASFVCASLPVTGFIFWLGRKGKRRG